MRRCRGLGWRVAVLAEVVERKERKQKASAVLAANLAVSTNQPSDAPDSSALSLQGGTRRAARIAAATAAAAAATNPLARVSLRVLEAVRPHTFGAPAAASAAAGGGGLVLYIVFEAEGLGENSRAQTRFNAPGSALVWLDPVRRGKEVWGGRGICYGMDQKISEAFGPAAW
jgi:hypothetical protein